MAYQTVIVAYDRAERAALAVKALRELGIPASDIKRHPVDATSVEEVAAIPETAGNSGLWRWLFGEDAVEDRIAAYRKALDAGGTIISVRVLGDETDRVQAELDRFGPVDLAAA